MSPRSSLTTNVLPSRMLTRSATLGPREDALEEHEQLWIAFDRHGAAQNGRHCIDLPAHDPVEQLRVDADRGIRLAVGVRDDDVAFVHLDEPALRLPVLELEAKRPLRLL